MLLRVEVENFRSFNTRQTFDMLAGEVLSHSELYYNFEEEFSVLKYAALFGPNASGKTNFINIFKFMKFSMLNGIPKLVSKDVFRLNGDDNKISKFEFLFKANNLVYKYNLHVDMYKSEVYEEKLSLVPVESNIENNIFIRTVNNLIVSADFDIDDALRNRLDIYASDILNMPNTLFISDLYKKNIKESEFDFVDNVYEWFVEQLVIIDPDMNYSELNKLIVREDKNLRLKFISKLDLKIDDYITYEMNEEEFVRQGVMNNEMLDTVKDFIREENMDSNEEFSSFLQDNTNHYCIMYNSNNDEFTYAQIKYVTEGKEFEYKEQSDGTKRILQLSDIFVEQKPKVYLIDEIDRSLHPLLTKGFVSNLLESISKTRSQLIVTTHETELLDLSIYRRDCFWFIERNENNESELFSLDQFKIRKDLKLSKAYLEGRFGALPYITESDLE